MTSGQHVVAIVQARMGSTRLPGKVLMEIAGAPMVCHVLRRAAQIDGVDTVVAAIPESATDDELADVCNAAGAVVIRGSSSDVLSRYALAAEKTTADVIVRLTADCPLLSPTVSTRVLAAFADCDYVSNTRVRSFPRGLDTEVFTADALAEAARAATLPLEREHVTPFIYRNPERFRILDLVDDEDRSGLRWTVDTPDDLAFAIAIYDELGPKFDLAEVVAVLDARPELVAINRDSVQKALE